MKDKFAFTVKYYDQKTLSIYIRDNELKEDHLCVQFTDLGPMTDFYLTVAASDDQGSCKSEIRDMTFISEIENQLIPQEDKKPGDPFFAYKDNLDRRLHFQNWEKYHQKFQL